MKSQGLTEPARRRKLIEVDSGSWPTTSIETVRSTCVRGKFQTFIFLEGLQSFWLDGAFFEIDAGHGEECRPKALTFALNRDTDIRLLRGTNKPLRKVSLTSPSSWMEEMQVESVSRSREVSDFMAGHLNHLIWEPGPDVLALCGQITQPPKWLDAEMQELYLSARGLDMMLAVCQRIGSNRLDVPARAPRNVQVQMVKVRDYLLAHLNGELNIARIARDTGTSVRSLQRQFRDHFGETVFEFVRGARLDYAREALMRDGISVGEAARLAGYKTQGSFSSAFKNRYGDVPRHIKDSSVLK